MTQWEQVVTFGGKGAMPFIGIRISGLEPVEPDLWTLTYRHRDHGSGRLYLREDTLEPVEGPADTASPLPPELRQPSLEFEGMRVKLAHDSGEATEPGVQYVLRWETLPPNHDRRREPPLPPASPLELVKLVLQSEGD